MKIKFCGAAREVTGSAHLLTLDDGFQILLDCGLYQGGGDDDGQAQESAEAKTAMESPMLHFNDKWLFNPAEIDCLVLSHAHIDHTGSGAEIRQGRLQRPDLCHPGHPRSLRDHAAGFGQDPGRRRGISQPEKKAFERTGACAPVHGRRRGPNAQAIRRLQLRAMVRHSSPK